MTHDPMCDATDKLWAQESDGSWRCMDCHYIAKVRADEKAKWTHVCPDNNCCNGGPN